MCCVAETQSNPEHCALRILSTRLPSSHPLPLDPTKFRVALAKGAVVTESLGNSCKQVGCMGFTTVVFTTWQNGWGSFCGWLQGKPKGNRCLGSTLRPQMAKQLGRMALAHDIRLLCQALRRHDRFFFSHGLTPSTPCQHATARPQWLDAWARLNA